MNVLAISGDVKSHCTQKYNMNPDTHIQRYHSIDVETWKEPQGVVGEAERAVWEVYPTQR